MFIMIGLFNNIKILKLKWKWSGLNLIEFIKYKNINIKLMNLYKKENNLLKINKKYFKYFVIVILKIKLIIYINN